MSKLTFNEIVDFIRANYEIIEFKTLDRFDHVECFEFKLKHELFSVVLDEGFENYHIVYDENGLSTEIITLQDIVDFI